MLGTPGRNDWPDGYSLANTMSFRFPAFQSTHLSQILGSRTSARAVSFLYALLAWNPSWRSSAQEALRHSYFRYRYVSNLNCNPILKLPQLIFITAMHTTILTFSHVCPSFYQSLLFSLYLSHSLSLFAKAETEVVCWAQLLKSYTRGKKDTHICLCMIWNIWPNIKPVKSHTTTLGFRLQTDMN